MQSAELTIDDNALYRSTEIDGATTIQYTWTLLPSLLESNTEKRPVQYYRCSYAIVLTHTSVVAVHTIKVNATTTVCIYFERQGENRQIKINSTSIISALSTNKPSIFSIPEVQFKSPTRSYVTIASSVTLVSIEHSLHLIQWLSY